MNILTAGRHLLTLINEILDLAKIESGTLFLSMETVALREIFQESREMMESLGGQRGIRMIFPQDCGVHVHADRTRLKQVILNLMSNAIKYNREMGMVIVECAPAESDRVRISVRDTGSGLGPDQLASLFQPFNRLGQEAGVEEGTGIGLVVTKRLVELMGGAIGVNSTVGMGSMFWIELGAVAAPVLPLIDAAAAPPPPIVHTLASSPTLLYVEDNPANLKLVEQILGFHTGLQLLSAPDGARGIALARAHLPDVILMDINLPGMSGAEARRILHDDPATAGIPVIALTANAMARDVKAGLDAGFFRYVTKPIKIDELIDAINSALAVRQRREKI